APQLFRAVDLLFAALDALPHLVGAIVVLDVLDAVLEDFGGVLGLALAGTRRQFGEPLVGVPIQLHGNDHGNLLAAPNIAHPRHSPKPPLAPGRATGLFALRVCSSPRRRRSIWRAKPA